MLNRANGGDKAMMGGDGDKETDKQTEMEMIEIPLNSILFDCIFKIQNI